MILYHASYVEVSNPDIVHSRNELDFGVGFYLTSLEEQAVKYAKRFLLRNKPAFVNTYILEYDPSNWKIKIFSEYDQEWLEFITKCRDGRDDSDYDMVVGGIANDRVFETLDDFFSGKIDAEKALGKLRFFRPNDQYCIRSQAMINECLKHIESRSL